MAIHYSFSKYHREYDVTYYVEVHDDYVEDGECGEGDEDGVYGPTRRSYAEFLKECEQFAKYFDVPPYDPNESPDNLREVVLEVARKRWG